ncbi:MAG TPA: polysaccharide deacetylase family protein [Methanocella sp.]|jgi:hypothetical protein
MTTQAYDLLKQQGDLWDLFTRKDDYHREKSVEHRSLYRLNGRGDVTAAPVSRFLGEHGQRWEFPEGHGFGVCLTHDIDDIYPPGRHMLLSAACRTARLDLPGAGRQFAWKLFGRNRSPYRNFREIIRLEQEYGGQSSFYFLGNGNDVRRFRYDVEDLAGDLGQIVDQGCEVGLHGGYHTYGNIEAMREEKRRVEHVLNRTICGYRNHYLSFKVPDTWDLLARAGFGYDTTLGYNDRPGFRNGMCHPFRPFSLTTGRPVDIVEIPLAIMDESLFWGNKTFAEAWPLARRLVDDVAACGGVITLLWHNNVFGSGFREAWIRMYEKILRHCKEKNAWITSGENIWKWGMKHDYFAY